MVGVVAPGMAEIVDIEPNVELTLRRSGDERWHDGTTAGTNDGESGFDDDDGPKLDSRLANRLIVGRISDHRLRRQACLF
jgi:hypothetical protein